VITKEGTGETYFKSISIKNGSKEQQEGQAELGANPAPGQGNVQVVLLT
jgi:hypothetical protein